MVKPFWRKNSVYSDYWHASCKLANLLWQFWRQQKCENGQNFVIQCILGRFSSCHDQANIPLLLPSKLPQKIYRRVSIMAINWIFLQNGFNQNLQTRAWHEENLPKIHWITKFCPVSHFCCLQHCHRKLVGLQDACQ